MQLRLKVCVSALVLALGLLTPSSDAAPAIAFEPAVAYDSSGWTGSGSGSIATADFDVDGHPDLVVADAPNRSVNVMRNNGDGTFAAPQKTVASMLDVYAVAAGDFNGDGLPDVAAGSELASLSLGALPDVTILLGRGDGTFTTAGGYTTGALPQQIVPTDFDLDGTTDLAVVGGSGALAVLLGNGDGTFHPGPAVFAGTGTTSVVAADLNGDGHPDLAVADGMLRLPHLDESTVWLLLWQPANGTLSPPIGLPVARVPEQVAAGDFDRDGRVDLVTANAGDDVISVLLNSPTGYLSYRTVPVGAGGAGAAVADFDRDGDDDIAIGRSIANRLSVLAGTGTGGFTVAGDYEVPGGPQAMAIADMDGDAWPDIAAAIGPGVAVLRNASAPSACPP